MRTALLATVLAFSVFGAQGQNKPDIQLTFAIDGKTANCADFDVELTLDQKSINPKHSTNGFDVPDVFKKAPGDWKDTQFVDIRLSCNGQGFLFTMRNPAFIQPGDWKLGVAHPLYAVREYGWTRGFERGAWLAYLIFEGEPGVVTTASQPDPPAGMSESLREEQRNASGGRARDIAYTLAVFNVEYARNRDYLLSLLKNCLSRPRESAEDDECDGDLLAFLTNLYWRGDESLLSPLLLSADTRRDVIDDIGRFYADLLERRCDDALVAMQGLPTEKQELICRMAYDDDLSIDQPKRDRVVALLRASSNETATRCADQLKNSQ